MTTNPTGADIGGVIAELRRLQEKAAPEPWSVASDEALKIKDAQGDSILHMMWIHLRGRRDQAEVSSTAALIVAARNALPSLLSHIAEMEERASRPSLSAPAYLRGLMREAARALSRAPAVDRAAVLERMIFALQQAEAQFRGYAVEHRKAEKIAKAATNEAFADLCAKALSSPLPVGGMGSDSHRDD